MVLSDTFKHHNTARREDGYCKRSLAKRRDFSYPAEFKRDLTVKEGIYFRGINFRGLKVSRFSRFRHFSQKFLLRHNLNSKFKVFAREITENSRFAKVFLSNFFRFLKFLLCCSLISPIFSLLGYKTL